MVIYETLYEIRSSSARDFEHGYDEEELYYDDEYPEDVPVEEPE